MEGMSCMVAVWAALASGALQAAPEDLPEAERALADTVDPWGLAFSDQLDRFASHFAERPDARFALGVTHDLVKVWPTKYWYTGEAHPSSATGGAAPAPCPRRFAAAGETQAFQVVVLPRMGADAASYRVEVEVDGAEGDRAEVFREVFVHTAEPAYPRFASERWPDPLLPEAEAVCEGLDGCVFLVDVALAPAQARRAVTVGVRVTDGVDEARATVPIEVVPCGELEAKAFPLVAWFPRQKLSDDAYRDLCAMLLAHDFQPLDALRGQWDEKAPERFDSLHEFLAAHGQTMFQVDGPDAEGFAALYAHLKERGWLDSAVIYSNNDEPLAETFETGNVPFCEGVRRDYPGLRVFLASDRHEGMERGCDVWLTDLSSSGYDPERDASLAAPELWHYYCHLPVRWQERAPLTMAPNMQIDNPALEHRVALWMSKRLGAHGVFVWGGSYYTFGDDFWQTLTLTDEPAKFPYAGIHNGNGWVVYPSPDGESAVPSLRLKVLRAGMQDLALQAALAREAEALPEGDGRRAELLALLDPTPGGFVRPHFFDRLPETLIARREAWVRALGELRRGE
jgi:hypothetical protein